MDTLATITPAPPLADFCAGFLSRHKEQWPPDESALAHEFIEQFPIGSLSRAEQMIAFAKDLGIDASLAALPNEMHGFNCATEKQTIVTLREDEGFPGSREHTFFHELREIMEYRFRDQGFSTAEGLELEKRAEQFAIAVRMLGLMKGLGPLIDGAKTIQQTWKRWLTVAGIVSLIVGAGAVCFLLPYFEQQFPRTKLK